MLRVAFFLIGIGIVSGCAPAPAATTATGPAGTTDPETVIDAAVHAYPDLEAAIPAVIADVALARWSFPSADDATADDVFGAALDRLGRSRSDVQIAVGVPDEQDVDLSVVVMRIPGLSGDALSSLVNAEFSADYTAQIVAGRSVLVNLGDDGMPAYVVVSHDVVYFIGGALDLTEAALAKLP